MYGLTLFNNGTVDLSLIFDWGQFSVVLIDAYGTDEKIEMWCGLGPLSLVLTIAKH
jgi:hypothetical protein